jgi:dimethylhistidine N-methyltransferase
LSPHHALAHAELTATLSARQASISPKYFYDQQGSALFERITALPEYYPTRTEASILQQQGAAMKACIPAGAVVIELGAGNCEKARGLCALLQPSCFVAVDISGDFLLEAAAGLRHAFPALDVRVVVADLFDDITLPDDLPPAHRLAFYPGSSIGNFDPETALSLLQRIRKLLGDDGSLLIGVDLIKERAVLDAAYNDAAGVTAAFNLNALRHVNRLIGSDFHDQDWRHQAFFNDAQSRIEMHLEARSEVQVHWSGGQRRFQQGERIHTENSYKYAPHEFAELLGRAGFQAPVVWTDPKQWFAVFLARL